MSLYERITAALDAEEAKARAATPGPWSQYGMAGVAATELDVVYEGPVECEECDWRVVLTGCLTLADAVHIAAQDPTTTLRRVEALRALVRLHGEAAYGPDQRCRGCRHVYPCPTLGLFAQAVGIDPKEDA